MYKDAVDRKVINAKPGKTLIKVFVSEYCLR